jgi:hypothetical protein
MRRRITVLLAMVMLAMMMAMAGAALAVPPQLNEHNCYGYFNSRATQGLPGPSPTPVSGHPGNEHSALQQGAREEFASCGANQGGSNF